MTRQPLRPRRSAITLIMRHHMNGNDVEFAVTYGFDEQAQIKEVFCKPFKLGTDLQNLLRQDSMVMSVALQHGASLTELAHVLGEDDTDKPARSIVGLMVRAGVTLETNIWSEAREASNSKESINA